MRRQGIQPNINHWHHVVPRILSDVILEAYKPLHVWLWWLPGTVESGYSRDLPLNWVDWPRIAEWLHEGSFKESIHQFPALVPINVVSMLWFDTVKSPVLQTVKEEHITFHYFVLFNFTYPLFSEIYASIWWEWSSRTCSLFLPCCGGRSNIKNKKKESLVENV